MRKILIISLMSISMIGLIGCQQVVKNKDSNVSINNSENKESNISVSESEDENSNVEVTKPELSQANSPYSKDYTNSFNELEAFGEYTDILYDEVKDNELINDIRLVLKDYWVNDGDIVKKNGVYYASGKGVVPFDKEKIDEITSAKEGVMSELKDKEMVDVVIEKVSWSNSAVSKELNIKSLTIKFRVVDSNGIEYITFSFGQLGFGLYSDNGVVRLKS